MQSRSLLIMIMTLTALALLIHPATGSAAAVRTPANTHLGVPPDKLVTLVSKNGSIGTVFKRLLPDGALSPSGLEMPFIVPSGQVLIVTDIDVASGVPYQFALVSSNITSGTAVALLDPGTSCHFTGGFAVPAGNGLSTGDIMLDKPVFIRGYLMTAP